MKTKALIKEIEQLPMHQRIYVIEQILHSMRSMEVNNQMEDAAESLYNDYKTDKALTEFTNIDFEDFYETK